MIPHNYYRHINPDGTEGGIVHNSSTVPDSVTVPSDCIVPERCKVAPNTTLPSGVLLRVDTSEFRACYSGVDNNGVHYYTAACEAGTYDELLALYNSPPKPEWTDWKGDPSDQTAIDDVLKALNIIKNKIEGM